MLNRTGLKRTPVRLLVLSSFLKAQSALSHLEVEGLVKEGTDRITIYRTLKTFEEKGVIHRIVDRSAVARYALCGKDCTADEHHDTHVHFSCTACGKVYCLKHTPVPTVAFPEGYTVENAELLAEGLCKNCS